jgi:hypothetical protein
VPVVLDTIITVCVLAPVIQDNKPGKTARNIKKTTAITFTSVAVGFTRSAW